MSKLSLELQTDLKNKAINLCCDITKLFDEFNSKKRKTDKSLLKSKQVFITKPS